MNNSSDIGGDNSSANVISPVEREKYYNIFRAHQPTNGVLDSSKARNVFLKSKLPNETLGQIWALADVRQSGTLTQSEFAIAMHYIAKLMDGTLSTLPTQLSPTVYSSASGTASSTPMLSHQQSPIARQMSGNSTPMIQHQLTGNRMMMTPPQRAATIDTLGNMAFSSSSESIPRSWDVTATEKTQYDSFFDKIDIQRHGFVQGKEAVEFFKNSQLPDADLAHIWDLADTSQRGRLSRNEFAVAMHLIHKRLRGDNLPPTLPATLIPPSPLPAPAPAPTPAVAVASPHSNLQRSVTYADRSFSNDPFNQPTKVASLIDEDLLGDFGNNDQLTQETNQVNQLQNQITQLKSATGDIKNEKLTAEQTLEQLSKQKQELQAQMTQVRMAHEAQVKDLNELQETIRQEEPEWIQMRNDFETSQQQLAAVQQEIQQLRQKLETGRAESEECRRRVHEIQEETAALEAQIDGLNGQVKQQGMMLDINRRQVTASEQDREQARRNLQDAKEVQGITESARGMDINSNVSSPKKSPASSNPPKKSTTDFSIDTPEDDSSSDDDDLDTAKPQNASSPFGNFTSTSPPPANTTQVHKDIDNSASSNNFFDIFSPHQEQAELRTSNQAGQPQTGGNDSADFDAVFGDLAGIPSPGENDNESAFNTATTTTPVSSSNSPFLFQSENTASSPVSTKKHRAPPPPPPPTKASSPNGTNDSTQQPQSMEYDFDSAFSGPLSEAKVNNDDDSKATGAQTTGKSDFDDFDDAFGVFDDEKSKAAATVTPSPSTGDGKTNTWPSQFGGFDFPDVDGSEQKKQQQQQATTSTATDADDWDSIFGGTFGASTTTAVKSPSSTTPGNQETVGSGSTFGFEDAFGATPFEAESEKKVEEAAASSSNSNNTTTATPTKKGNQVFTETNIVGDGSKVDELVKMGFEKQVAKDALERYDQDVTKATNFLLDQTN
ncbi:unnamed protein product [Absidia cylindrospora]